MNVLKCKILFLVFFVLVNSTGAFHFKALEFYARLLNGEFLESGPFGSGSSSTKTEEKTETTESRAAAAHGQWHQSTLHDYLTYKDKDSCSVADESELTDGLNPDGSRKTSLRVKCNPVEGNGTFHIITLKETVTGFAHNGNATKRNEVGSCFLMLFYSKTCIHSAMAAPHFNALARHFPDLLVTAVDAHNFHFLNAEFGIVGLPTFMLFHQGRPLVKYNGTEITLASLAKFVTRHTGIEPRLVNQKSSTTVLHYISDDFIGPLSNKVEYRTDYWLYIAWLFIIMCTCYYFSKSTLYAQIIEMIKRNWRESAAQHS
ncbi:thioredoxin domain-containing protein 15 [Anopheles nili]|uniref:thioredoxin domain-containing protein 15 n=1 Tax=Anopheles nili TaxID=185578 RepID=UPI00237C2EFC|nr:thioredoxin domain-containing protein 15 [Anopheles nili]